METNTTPKSVRWLVIAAGVFLIAGLALSGFNAYMAFAAPLQQTYAGPTTVGFEGYLTDAGGDPQDGTFDLTFRLYDVDTGGTALWTEPHSGVEVTDGLYSVQLGESVPLDSDDFGGARWLGIEVNTDGEMAPRIPISAVPWALNASGLTGHPVAAAAPQVGEALVWDGSDWGPLHLLPQHASLMFDEFGGLGGSPTYWRPGSATPDYGFLVCAPNADGSGFESVDSLVLRAGTYDIYLLRGLSGNQGQFHVYIKHAGEGDYTQVTTSPIDNYKSTIEVNNIVTVSSVAFEQDGVYSIKFVVNGKNPASSGYYLCLTKLWIIPNP